MRNFRKYNTAAFGFFCAGSFVSVTSSCSTYHIERAKHRDYKEWAKYQWKEEECLGEKTCSWVTYSRKIKGSKYKEFKIIGEVNATPENANEALVTNGKPPRGKWKFESLENDRSKATYVIHANSEGSIPVWEAHSKVEKELSKELERVRTIVQKPK